jgi:hypothetical protein
VMNPSSGAEKSCCAGSSPSIPCPCGSLWKDSRSLASPPASLHDTLFVNNPSSLSYSVVTRSLGSSREDREDAVTGSGGGGGGGGGGGDRGGGRGREGKVKGPRSHGGRLRFSLLRFRLLRFRLKGLGFFAVVEEDEEVVVVAAVAIGRRRRKRGQTTEWEESNGGRGKGGIFGFI